MMYTVETDAVPTSFERPEVCRDADLPCAMVGMGMSHSEGHT